MNEPQIVVCIKQVADPEGPDSAYEIDSEARSLTPRGIPPVINPFDERALESALHLKDKLGGKVIVINMVEDKLAIPVLKKALAAGADELIVLKDESFINLNSFSTAYVLSAAIRRIDKYSLILAGRQAADWGFGQVGPILAEILQIPGIGVAQRVNMEEGMIVAERLRRSGYEILKVPAPALITMDSEVDLRLATLKDIKDAGKKPIITWDASDLSVDSGRLETMKIYQLSAPPSRKRQCLIINGQTMQEKVDNMVLKLREDRVI